MSVFLAFRFQNNFLSRIILYHFNLLFVKNKYLRIIRAKIDREEWEKINYYVNWKYLTSSFGKRIKKNYFNDHLAHKDDLIRRHKQNKILESHEIYWNI